MTPYGKQHDLREFNRWLEPDDVDRIPTDDA
jgi:hypothetical protein